MSSVDVNNDNNISSSPSAATLENNSSVSPPSPPIAEHQCSSSNYSIPPMPTMPTMPAMPSMQTMSTFPTIPTMSHPMNMNINHNMNMNMNMNINMHHNINPHINNMNNMNNMNNINNMMQFPMRNDMGLPITMPVPMYSNIGNITPRITTVPVGSSSNTKTNNEDNNINKQMSMLNLNQRSKSNGCTLNSIGVNAQRKYSLQSQQYTQYLHQISQLQRAKQMYEQELQKLKQIGQLSSDYKKPSFPDLSGIIDNNNNRSNINNTLYQAPPITQSISSPSITSITSNSKSQLKPKDGANNKNDEEKKVSQNDIVTIVGGRVVLIPPVHVPTHSQQQDEDNDDEKDKDEYENKNKNENENENKNESKGHENQLLSSLNNLKGLPDLSSLRSYSVSNGFCLKQRSEQRLDLRSSRLKRSRTTFEVRGSHSSKKMKQRGSSGSSIGLKGGLRERTRPRTITRQRSNGNEQKTTLLTLNDISANDRHVQRGVRRMLRNVDLMRKRSSSCISLSSVKE